MFNRKKMFSKVLSILSLVWSEPEPDMQKISESWSSIKVRIRILNTSRKQAVRTGILHSHTQCCGSGRFWTSPDPNTIFEKNRIRIRIRPLTSGSGSDLWKITDPDPALCKFLQLFVKKYFCWKWLIKLTPVPVFMNWKIKIDYFQCIHNTFLHQKDYLPVHVNFVA
jgi:hypothetical protein